MNTTNDIRATIDIITPTASAKIKIRLNDECQNGHEDFAITADFWTPCKPRIDKYHEIGGCCHEEILTLRPDLAPFVALHLSDATGAPIFTTANGFYHLKDKAVFLSYMRCTEMEYNYFLQAEDEAHFTYLLQTSDLPARWKKEADAAIEQLEKMHAHQGAEVKFKSTATCSNFKRLTDDEIREMEAKIAAGYYTPEAIAQRAAEKMEEIRQKRLAKVEAEYQAKKDRYEKKYQVECQMAILFPTKKNFIYYDHSNELKFNWLSYEPVFTPEEIEAVREALAQIKGITFKE